MNTDDGNTRNPPSRKAVEKSMLDHAVANAEEIASLRAQLAAVEKERDGHWRSFCRSEQERVAVEKERDKLKEENSRLWAEAGDSSAVQARKERDAATGALAAAMEVLRRVESDHADAEADMKAEWGKVDGGELYGHAWGYMTNAFNGVSAFLASPAADLAARHDAEVARRALEKAAQLVWSAEPTCDEDGPGESFRSLADRIAKLATPTPEKPKP